LSKHLILVPKLVGLVSRIMEIKFGFAI